MRILIDMDGVLADFSAAIDRYARAAGAPAPTAHACRHFDLEGRYPDVAHVLRDAIRQPGFYADLDPVAGAVAGVGRLQAAGLDVWVCTAPVRSRWCAGEKVDWVARHLGYDLAGRTVVTKDKTVVAGDVLIDDKPTVTGADRPRWRHLLFAQPYNVHVQRPRLESWDVDDLVEQVTAPS